jgi:hypothetical protein
LCYLHSTLHERRQFCPHKREITHIKMYICIIKSEMRTTEKYNITSWWGGVGVVHLFPLFFYHDALWVSFVLLLFSVVLFYSIYIKICFIWLFCIILLCFPSLFVKFYFSIILSSFTLLLSNSMYNIFSGENKCTLFFLDTKT